MKYLKVFEAFESNSLSKTLSFINKESKSIFLDILKKIGDGLDIKLSDISDEFIEYLPYRKALNKFLKEEVVSEGDKSCSAKSIDAFKASGINGEKCNGGKIKRKWGSGIRTVLCPICEGTGITKVKKSTTPNLQLIKIWFNKDGKYITSTGVDGRVVNPSTSSLLGDYIIDNRDMTYDELLKLPEGTVIGFSNEHSRLSDITLAVVHHCDGRVYLLQNKFDGSEPSDWTAARKLYGYRRSWNMGKNSFSHLRLLTKKSDYSEKDIEESKKNPFNYNFKLAGGLMSCSTTRISDRDISDAHFALVMDISKIRNMEKVLSYTRDVRKKYKKGATALLKPEEVKKLNITRYLAKLTEVNSNIADSKKVILRLLGGNKLILILKRSDNLSILNDTLGYYNSLMSYINEDGEVTNKKDFNLVENRLKDYVKSKMNFINNKKMQIVNRLEKYKTEHNTDQYTNQIKLIAKIEELSQHVYNRISEQELKSVDDIQVLYNQLISLRSILSSGSSSNPFKKTWEYFLQYCDHGSELDTVLSNDQPGYSGNIPEIIKYIDRIKLMVDKIF